MLYFFIYLLSPSLFSQDSQQPTFHLNYSLSLAQSANDDWKTGKNLNFEINNSVEPSFTMNFGEIQFFSRLKYAIGVKYEYIPDSEQKFIIPTDNSLEGEAGLRLIKGWKIDPFFSVNFNTQITESFVKNNTLNTYQRTANFRDPITSQQSWGFAYSINGIKNKLNIYWGISAKQIRADKYTQMTDNRSTQELIEKYNTQTGLQLKIENINEINPSLQYHGRLDLYNEFANMNIWQIKSENELIVNIWKLFGIVIKFDFFYDEKIKPQLYYKQNMRVGLVGKI